MSKLLFLVTLATMAAAHKPRIYEIHFAPYAKAPTFPRLVKLGESYHNAWKQCYEKTVEWMQGSGPGQLNIEAQDPTFDNSYYIEYGIKSRVPETYSLFQEFLGTDRYWDPPSFSGSNHHITWGQLDAQTQGITGAHEANEEYDQGKWWIEEHNHPTTKGSGARVYDPNNVDIVTKRKLKQLFYNIQQTSYYCDFTLESGMFTYKKFEQQETVDLIQAEREAMSMIWHYILKEEVAPMRWAMKLWTRYNIAEPAIHKVIKHFEDDWELAINAAESIGASGAAYNQEKNRQHGVVQGWIGEFRRWIHSCYDNRRPNDDIIQTSSQVCHDGITFADLKDGKKESKRMWYRFFLPILESYKAQHGENAAYRAAYKDIWESVMALGEPHSFRCEFIWLITRVRYFEIIPTWELQRIQDDTQDKWDILIGQRAALLAMGITAEGHFADEVVDDMESKKDQIKDFLGKWIVAHDDVFDSDGELHRLTLRRLTKEHSDLAQEIYRWHWQMGFAAIEKKDEALPIDLKGNTNTKWTDQSRLGNSIVKQHSRDGFRMWVWRELVKLHFHTWRRI